MRRTRVNLAELTHPQGVLDAERKRELVTCLRCHASAVLPTGPHADRWRRLHQWQHHAGADVEHYRTEPVLDGAA